MTNELEVTELDLALHNRNKLPPEQKAKRKYKPRHRAYKYRYREPKNLPFIAWDGEGYTDESGEHHYMLFGCSTGDYIADASLDHRRCFNLMLDVAKFHKGIHVIFSGGYDVVMMIRKYPTRICERILKGKVTWYDGYRHEYFKGKYLKLSDGTRSIVLYDVFTFFSTSFVRALREYLGESDDFDRIENTKLLRDSFTESDLETMILPYMQQELKYLVELCEILRTRLIDAGIRPTQWHGPGAVASAVLKARGIKAHMAETPEPVREAARHAYFGGRFEQFQIGYREGDIYQYDIRSAYPYAITRLPSLASIEWVNRKRYKERFNPYGIYLVGYSANENVTLNLPGPLPWRHTNKSIYYPHDIYKGWYWGIELQAVQRGNTGTITVYDSWEPKTDPTDFPFRWVGEMYAERARMKKEGNPTQLALKLAMNSLYGKLAQSKGAKLIIDAETGEATWRIPAYHQLEWAGWITAASRAKLYDAMLQAGSSLIAVETDAVYCTKKLDLPCSEQLGDWEEEIAEAIMYVQSGVYFKKQKGTWKLKSRGFEPRNHTFESWYDVMRRLPHEPDASVSLTLRRFGGVPGRDNFARWYEMQRTATVLQKDSKRIHMPLECVWCDRGHNMVEFQHTLIVPQYALNCNEVQSHPHSLPWIDGPAFDEWDEEWIITEEGFSELDML